MESPECLSQPVEFISATARLRISWWLGICRKRRNALTAIDPDRRDVRADIIHETTLLKNEAIASSRSQSK